MSKSERIPADLNEPEILRIDPLLSPFKSDILLRMELLGRARQRLLGSGQSLSDFANGHLFFGFHKQPDGWIFREWAPSAVEIALMGDFNGWNRESHKLTRLDGGNWEIFIPGTGSLTHGSRVRLVITAGGRSFERIPLYCRRLVQDENTKAFDGLVWEPSEPYRWRTGSFKLTEPPLIYECHIGMAGEEERVATFNEFTEKVLPRIKNLGYNTIQIMAVMEHPYYGSFGYQVSNFFAVSSRFGTPEDLKNLVDAAHSLGIAVLLDIVHSHAARNEAEGIGAFDGTAHQFFHAGAKGDHPAWGTKLFNYGKSEVLHFLLSNVKFWLEEYRFDGFRFDGVTSMLYHDHGLGCAFDNYGKYFSLNTHTEAITYLQLASEAAREVNPDCILVAEDMSGMPGMCIPIKSGGIGFDYRLSMGLPDFWIRTIRSQPDELWSMGGLWYELSSRRPQEKVIGYCESHDQALVGDKTLIFWLADKEMYWQMNDNNPNPIIDRALSLHKMIRLITCTSAGDGYLNFMGNEFGHPEWIDFPREGNNWSYHYCRRLWHLADDPNLRYHYLQDFDRAMIRLVRENKLLGEPSSFLMSHESGKILAYSKGDFVFIFNFSPTLDFTADIYLSEPGMYELVLHSNWKEFGGYCDREPETADCRLIEKRPVLRIGIHKRAAAVYKKKP